MHKETIPVKIYTVRTNCGSLLQIRFLYADTRKLEDGTELRIGYMHVIGHSVSKREDISFSGPGVEPEVGMNVGVAVRGVDEDGDTVFDCEQITRIEKVEEVKTKGVNYPTSNTYERTD